MVDNRVVKLTNNIVNYSLELKPKENVLIEVFGYDKDFINAIIKEVFKVGAYPHLEIKNSMFERSKIKYGCENYYNELYDVESSRMEKMDAYIGVRLQENSEELTNLSSDSMNLYSNLYSSKLHMGIRCPKTRWVVLRYPTPSMAQSARMSTEDFEDFYFNVCNLDYKKMSRAMTPLKELMEKTNIVRIVGKGTDISFSIKDMGVEKCSGNCNLPDGEIYSAPVKNSVNGYITYNTTSLERGFVFDNVKFEFKDGKIIKANANDAERLNSILDLDEGARYIGEFAIGVNPYIINPMNETLFDEKIMGSIHFTPGNCVAGCKNGNSSIIHWDLVLIQTPEYGGGEIYFDGELIRKDGMFVKSELVGLNAENLK